MKKKILSLGAVLLFAAGSIFAQEAIKEFNVNGNCKMCKAKIEKAAKSVEGVKTAEWNKETKILKLKFETSKTNVDAVQKAIAKVGYDTPKHKSTESDYATLPNCCHYKRDGEKSTKK